MQDQLYSIFNVSEDKHWWFRGRRRIILDLVKIYLPPRSDCLILDVGCGAGETLSQLGSLGKPFGVDISEEAVVYARRRGCSKVSQVDGIELPYHDEKFDLVLSLDVLEHIEDEKRSLSEYQRVLKTGGRLFLTVPAYRWLWSGHDDDNLHLRRYGRQRLIERLRSAELEVERLTYFCSYLFPLIAAVRLTENLSDRVFKSHKVGRDFRLPTPPLNNILERIFARESVRISSGRNFPFGSSLLAVCQKKFRGIPVLDK